MHDFSYPSYLHTHRKRWALSQRELGDLLGGMSPGIVSKYERLTRTPPVHVLVGSEFIFGEPARRLFPALYASVELSVTTHAVALAETLAGKSDRDSVVKRELLEAIALRAAGDTSHI